MRDLLQRVVRTRDPEDPFLPPDHAGLAYDAWAPLDTQSAQPTFKIPDDDRNNWLDAIRRLGVPDGYRQAFERWKSSFQGDGVTWTADIVLDSRLLIGHGNSSPTEVGLTLHHTWGVPVIPGSALKGLTAHYVETVYGTDDNDWHGVQWNGNRIQHRPGKVYAELFGSPDAEEDGDDEGALQGCIHFHDALYIPGTGHEGKPLAPDVLTVHQKSYYNSKGETLPNDYDSPNPVGFLTVAPGTKFHLAISGQGEWGRLAAELVVEALTEWGVGGKTSAGYGRIKPNPKLHPPTTKRVCSVLDWIGVECDRPASERPRGEILNDFEAQWYSQVLVYSALEREVIADKLTERIHSRGAGVKAACVARLLKADEDERPFLEWQFGLDTGRTSQALRDFAGLLADQPADADGLTAVQEHLLGDALHGLSPAEKEIAREGLSVRFPDPTLQDELVEALSLLE